MAVLTTEFEIALQRIEPSDADKNSAPLAHNEVRKVLESNPTLKVWDINPVLIGSYKRHVSIRRVKDVDVFCRLDSLHVNVDPQDLLTLLFETLDTLFGVAQDGTSRVKRQDRSVQVLFPEYDGLYVDAVPARPVGDGTWEIPQRIGDGTPWQQTNPEKFTELSSAMNDRHGHLYVRTVKLVRQARRNLLGAGHPGGLWFEAAVYDACLNGTVPAAGNLAEHFTAAIEGAAERLNRFVHSGVPLPDPTMPGHLLQVRATEREWEHARDVFGRAAHSAREAMTTNDRCLAAARFRELLGGNDDFEHVFPMPDDCNDDGTRKFGGTLLSAGERHVPAGNRRFG